MMNENQHKRLLALIEQNKREQKTPSLLLHCCCAVCASGVIELLYPNFNLTLFYYNPNIYPNDEMQKRYEELKRLPSCFGFSCDTIADFSGVSQYEALTEPLSKEAEGGARCIQCFGYRLAKTEELATKLGFDYYATTLTVSPLKNSLNVNDAGIASQKGGSLYLPSDFKKQGGYQKSIENSKKFDIYRQNYCGCKYSFKN